MVGRKGYLAIKLRVKSTVPIVRGTKGAHPARVRAFVAIEGALVIARRLEKAVAVTGHERVERAFGTTQKLFDDYAAAGLAEPALIHHSIDRLKCGRLVRRDDHALTKSEAVGFDHDRIRKLLAIRHGFMAIGKTTRLRRRNVFPVHQFLGKNLGRFQLRRCLVRAENAQTLREK